MKKKFILFFLILVFCLNTYALTDKMVAVVNDEVITQSEVDSFLKVLSVELYANYKDKRLEEELNKLKIDILNRLIEDKLIQQEAKKQHIQIKKDAVASKINQLKREYYSEEEFYEALEKQGLTLADIEKKITDQLVAYYLIEREVRGRTQVKPTQVTAFYQGHQEEFKDPERRLVSSIFIQTKEEAEKIITLLNNGEDFLGLKEKYSQRESLGEVVKGQLRQEIEEPIFALKENEYSNTVATEEGFYIFKIEKIIPPRLKELFEVQEVIYNFLFEEEMQKRMDEWLAELKNEAHIVIK